jgi:LmbE family N-acetylglucosaminyl deacetylase
MASHAIEARLAGYHDVLVAAPLGIGNHIDHLAVARVAKVLERRGMNVMYYEDVPYAGRLDDQEYRALTMHLSRRFRPILVNTGDVIVQKLANLRLYRSQIQSWEVDETTLHSRRINASHGESAERLWVRKHRKRFRT